MVKESFVELSEVCFLEKGKTGLMKAVAGKYTLVATGKERRTSDSYQFDAKAVCIPLVSSTGHGHASLKYVHYQEGKFALGTILVAVIPKDENILNAQFLHLYLSRLKDEILVPLMTGAANVTLTVTKLKKVKIPLPSIEKQRTIVSLFNRMDKEQKELTLEIETQQTLLKKLRQSILQEAIEGKLTASWREENRDIESASVLLEKIKAEKEQLIKEKKIKRQKALKPISESEIPFEIPDGWVWSNIDNTVIITRGSSPRPIQSYITEKNDGVNWIKIGDTKNVVKYISNTAQKITIEGARKSQEVIENDFILSNSMSFGKPFIMKTKGYIHDGWFLIRLLTDVNIDFFYYLLSSNFIQEQFKDSASGAVVQNIRADIVKKTILPLPPLQEQKQIVKKIESLFKICDELEEKIGESKKSSEMLMQSVLREAFVG